MFCGGTSTSAANVICTWPRYRSLPASSTTAKWKAALPNKTQPLRRKSEGLDSELFTVWQVRHDIVAPTAWGSIRRDDLTRLCLKITERHYISKLLQLTLRSSHKPHT